MTDSIRTERLDLIPMTPACLRALLQADFAVAAELLGASFPEGRFDVRPVFERRLRQLESDSGLLPWLLRAMVFRDERMMVGYIGFHAAPGAAYLDEWSPGGVEYGFTVFPPYRRRGFAREAAIGLMAWAERIHGVRSFVATVSPTNVASQALVASLGFVKVGSHEDEVDGTEDVLVRRLS